MNAAQQFFTLFQIGCVAVVLMMAVYWWDGLFGEDDWDTCQHGPQHIVIHGLGGLEAHRRDAERGQCFRAKRNAEQCSQQRGVLDCPHYSTRHPESIARAMVGIRG